MTRLNVRVVKKPNMGAFLKRVEGRSNGMLQKAALDVERNAKRLAPVDTGRLRSSIRNGRLKPGTWFVSANVHYAVHQEFGTRSQAGTPFIRPAVEVVRRNIARKYGD